MSATDTQSTHDTTANAVGSSDLFSVMPERDDLWAKYDSLSPALCAEALVLAGKMEVERNRYRAALEQIEERFIDGDNTYDDWKFMGEIARAALNPENPKDHQRGASDASDCSTTNPDKP